jgi:ankyrin repeat protein
MRPLFLTISLLLTVTTAVTAQAPPDNRSQREKLLTSELFIAIRDKDAAGVNTVLARGADPNATNWLGFTPLMWAAMRGNQQIADTLLAHHAKLEAASIYGTPLTFALVGRQEALALHLLDKGASIHAARIDGATVLMLAAANGYPKVIERLIVQKDDLNTKDNDGATALLHAARSGRAATVQALLKAGANVDAKDSHGRTALMYAAANGHPQVVDLLLAKHAAVNAKDREGATALLLAARYCGSAAVVGSLLHGGADASVKDSRGATPLSQAAARGYEEAAAALRKAGAPAAPQESAPPTSVRTGRAIEKSLAVLQTSMKSFASRMQCTSCHHQGMGMMTLGLAQRHGFAVDKALIGSYLKHLGDEGREGAPFIHLALDDANVAKTIQAVDIGDFSIGSAYILGGLIANGIPGNPGLAESALFLARQQDPDGHWGYGVDREPIQSSYLTTTALVLQVLRTYGPQEKADQLAPCYAHARHWLLTTPAPNTEDKASRLLGIKWAGAGPEERERPLQELLASQRPDGGWSQLPAMPSDAYATGLALYALHVGGGMATEDPAYQRGVQFLLRTQDEDGSWYVNKRTAPANTYFDAGFPHGESQFTSFGATCWATMALLQGRKQ